MGLFDRTFQIFSNSLQLKLAFTDVFIATTLHAHYTTLNPFPPTKPLFSWPKSHWLPANIIRSVSLIFTSTHEAALYPIPLHLHRLAPRLLFYWWSPGIRLLITAIHHCTDTVVLFIHIIVASLLLHFSCCFPTSLNLPKPPAEPLLVLVTDTIQYFALCAYLPMSAPPPPPSPRSSMTNRRCFFNSVLQSFLLFKPVFHAFTCPSSFLSRTHRFSCGGSRVPRSICSGALI